MESPIQKLLEAVALQLKPLQDDDLLRILIRGSDRQPVGFQELQVIYTGSTPVETYNSSCEAIANVDLYLITQELYTPRGAYYLIPRIANLLAGFSPYHGAVRFAGDRKTVFDEAQQILGFTLSYQIPVPAF